MFEPNDKALLPEGLHDTLTRDAEYEDEVVGKLLERFGAYGYERVSPPLVEFEESLLSGLGKDQSRHMFRLLDPVSSRMMGVRTDMTMQVARIARTRLGNVARPLRLCYAGDVLRVRGTQLRPERQFIQAGVELIGSDSGEAYVEVVLLAHEAISRLGVGDLHIDLTLPLLVPAICEGLGVEQEVADTFRQALNARDIGVLQSLDGQVGDISRALMSAAGPAVAALEILENLKLPPKAAAMCEELSRLVARLADVAPGLDVTVDPGDYLGFEFQSGIGFTLFASGVRGELGRGGRYVINADRGESATGFSLYLDSLMRALPVPAAYERVYIPFGTDPSEIAVLQEKGLRTVQGFDAVKDSAAEAKRQNCTSYWQSGQINQI